MRGGRAGVSWARLFRVLLRRAPCGFFCNVKFFQNQIRHMKQKFLFAILALTIATAANAQRYFDLIAPTADTLVNQDTVIYTTATSGGPTIIDVPYHYSVHVKADSVSGANAGFCYLQVSNHRSGSVWYT